MINTIVDTFTGSKTTEVWDHSTEVGTYYSVEVAGEERSRAASTDYRQMRRLAFIIATR